MAAPRVLQCRKVGKSLWRLAHGKALCQFRESHLRQGRVSLVFDLRVESTSNLVREDRVVYI